MLLSYEWAIVSMENVKYRSNFYHMERIISLMVYIEKICVTMFSNFVKKVVKPWHISLLVGWNIYNFKNCSDREKNDRRYGYLYVSINEIDRLLKQSILLHKLNTFSWQKTPVSMTNKAFCFQKLCIAFKLEECLMMKGRLWLRKTSQFGKISSIESD